MSRAMQKYAEARGINLAEASQEGRGQVAGGEASLLADQASQQTDAEQLQRQQGETEDVSGIGLGGGMALGKAGSMLRDAAAKGSKVLSTADKAAARASRIARATGNDSVADGIDAARASGRSAANAVGDTVSGLEKTANGVSDVSRSGLSTMVDNASNISSDLIRLAPNSTNIAAQTQATVSNTSRNIMGTGADDPALQTSDGAVQDSRGFLSRMFSKAPAQPDELEDEGTRLANIRDERQAAGDFDAPQDQDLLQSIRTNPNLNPALTAPDQAVADSGRSIGDVASDFASKTADDLVAGGTTQGRIARGVTTAEQEAGSSGKQLLGGLSGDSTLARAGAVPQSDNPFSLQRFGAGTEPEAGFGQLPKTTSKFGDVLQTQQEDVAPLEGEQITHMYPSSLPAPRAQPPAASTNLDANAPASGGASQSSTLGRNGGTSEQTRLNQANSNQQDSDLTSDLTKDTSKLDQSLDPAADPALKGLSSGATEDVEEGLSLSDKFMKYGGTALEGLGFAGDLAGIGMGIYDMVEEPTEKEIQKQRDKISADMTTEAVSKPISYGSISGATMSTAPEADAGTFQHF